MEYWLEAAIGTVIVVLVSLLLGFSNIPDGIGKLFAYFGIALIPVVAIQYKKIMDGGLKIKTGEFVFALILNTFLVLLFSILILVFIGKI